MKLLNRCRVWWAYHCYVKFSREIISYQKAIEYYDELFHFEKSL